MKIERIFSNGKDTVKQILVYTSSGLLEKITTEDCLSNEIGEVVKFRTPLLSEKGSSCAKLREAHGTVESITIMTLGTTNRKIYKIRCGELCYFTDTIERSL